MTESAAQSVLSSLTGLYMRQNKLISFSQTFLSMCRETSEPGLGILKDCLWIIEQLIVSKLVSHLLAEYICSFEQSLYFFPFSPLPQLKSTKVLYSNYSRTCHSNSAQHLRICNGKEQLLLFYVAKKTIFFGKVLSVCIVNACQCRLQLSLHIYNMFKLGRNSIYQEGIQFIILRLPAIMTKF